MMAGTDVLGRLRTFSVSVRLSTFCAISSAPRTKCYERKWDSGLKLEEVKANSSVTSLHMMNQWRCQGALVDRIYCLWMFFSSFTFSSTFAKVWFTLNVQINCRNGVTAACFHSPHFLMKRRKTAEHLSDIAGYVTFSSALNCYYYYFFFLCSTCKDKEIIFREAKVLVNLYCRMIHVSLFLFFTSLEY